MGHRELKRVPLGFDHPLWEVWEGYINPYPPEECSECGGTGYNPETKQIADEFYDFEGIGSRGWRYDITQDEVQALVDEGRLMQFTHEWVSGEGWKPKRWDTRGFWCPECREAVPQLSPKHHSCFCTGCEVEMLLLEGDDVRLHIPTAEEVNAWERRGGFGGHYAINRCILVEARAKRLGVYGFCPTCGGEGVIFESEEHQKLHDEWQEYDPPTGQGYQLWETVTEGSPITPEFASATALALWCENHATILADEKISREDWLTMFTVEGALDVGSSLFTIKDESIAP